MKQYTTSEQTAKLIELKLLPKYISKRPISEDTKSFLVCDGFSIGELIEMLPEFIDNHYYTLNISIDNDSSPSRWLVEYFGTYRFRNTELIDALFNLLVLLKEEGVI